MSATFTWASQGLDQARFQALAKLLRLRSGGQIEEPEDSIHYLDIELERKDVSDNDSTTTTVIHDTGQTRLKRAFLDRLAEVVSEVKGGPDVSASLMIEWTDKVDILVAKNTGIDKGTAAWTFLTSRASNMQSLARSGMQISDSIKNYLHMLAS